MLLSLQYPGKVFNVYAIRCNDGVCPAADFLAQVKQNEPSSHKSLLNVVIRHADHGMIKNNEKSRMIKGYDGLFEFKSRQGARLIYFYLTGGKTILTNGFCKGDPPKEEYKKAKQIKDQYLREVGHGN